MLTVNYVYDDTMVLLNVACRTYYVLNVRSFVRSFEHNNKTTRKHHTTTLQSADCETVKDVKKKNTKTKKETSCRKNEEESEVGKKSLCVRFIILGLYK